MPEHLRAAILLAAFAGLGLAETRGLRTADIGFMRAVIRPELQHPAETLKTEISRTPVPVARSLTLAPLARLVQWPGRTVLTDRESVQVGPWKLERAIRSARRKVRNCTGCGVVQASASRAFRCSGCNGVSTEPGLPDDFRYHDLRHYFVDVDGSKARANRARWAAQRQGYRLEKNPRRDPRGIGFGAYRVAEARTGEVVASFGWDDRPAQADRLTEAEGWLRGEEA